MVPHHGPRNSSLHRAKGQPARDFEAEMENARLRPLGIRSKYLPSDLTKLHLKWLEYTIWKDHVLSRQFAITKKPLFLFRWGLGTPNIFLQLMCYFSYAFFCFSPCSCLFSCTQECFASAFSSRSYPQCIVFTSNLTACNDCIGLRRGLLWDAMNFTAMGTELQGRALFWKCWLLDSCTSRVSGKRYFF